MNLNRGLFSAYNHRYKQSTVGYRLPLNNQQHHTSYMKSARSAIEPESFLPSVTTGNGGNAGHRPYRRNDFANNHLFITKHKLARFFDDQPTMNIQSTNDLIHLFDQHEPKRRSWSVKRNKRREINPDLKSTPTLDEDVHLSIVNLTMKPSPSAQPRDSFTTRTQTNSLQIRAPRSSLEWINPAVKQDIQSVSNHTIESDFEPNTTMDDSIDNNFNAICNTINPFDSSLLYVKSIIPSAAPPPSHHH